MEERSRIITGRGHSNKGRARPLLPLAPETIITSQTIISDRDLVLHDRVEIGKKFRILQNSQILIELSVFSSSNSSNYHSPHVAGGNSSASSSSRRSGSGRSNSEYYNLEKSSPYHHGGGGTTRTSRPQQVHFLFYSFYLGTRRWRSRGNVISQGYQSLSLKVIKRRQRASCFRKCIEYKTSSSTSWYFLRDVFFKRCLHQSGAKSMIVPHINQCHSFT